MKSEKPSGGDDAGAAQEIVFVLKASKFCNLRCAYCYEHRELHVRDVMRLDTLARLFEDVDRFGDHLLSLGVSPAFSFVWHGGEPLLIARDYYAQIVQMQKMSIRRFPYRNSVQTNLVGSVADTLQFVVESGWQLGVSIDFAGGVRTNAGGRDSNASVIAAAERLRKSGGRFGAISVLGTHNCGTLVEMYDWVAEFADGWRILPVFDGGPEDAIEDLRLSEGAIVDFFVQLLKRRARAARHVPIAPLDGYISAAALKIADQRRPGDVTRHLLDNIYLVNVNGDVFTRPFAYETEFCLGNIQHTSMVDIVEHATYRACQRAIRQRKICNCASCEFRGFCDSTPMHEHGSVTREEDGLRCFVTRRAIAATEACFVASGVDRKLLATWAADEMAARRPACVPASGSA